MPTFEGPTYTATIEWDTEGKPVLYVIGRGRVKLAKDALTILQAGVNQIESSPHQYVCVVYNVLEMAHVPSLRQFVTVGRFPTSMRTRHIIVGTLDPAIRLLGTLAAVSFAKRMRTLDVCTTAAEIDVAIKRWLMLPDTMRALLSDKR